MVNINTLRITILAIVIGAVLSSYINIIGISDYPIRSTIFLFIYLILIISIFYNVLKDFSRTNTTLIACEMALYFMIAYTPVIIQLVDRIDNKFCYLFYSFHLLTLALWLTLVYRVNENRESFRNNKILNWTRILSIWLAVIFFLVFLFLHFGWKIPEFRGIFKENNISVEYNGTR